MTDLLAGATVYAKDPARVSRFYERVCALDEVEREAGFVVLAKRGIEVVVVRIPPHIADTIVLADPVQRREDTALKLVFAVDSIAAARATAQALGGVIDPSEREWAFRGTTVCDGHDPEGNVVQLREAGRRPGG